MSRAQNRQAPIWLLVLGLVAAAASVAIFALEPLEAFGARHWWLWPLCIAGFALADATVVRVHSGSETTAFTFIELPLFLGAIYVSPTLVWVAMTSGVAVSVLVLQRIPLFKAAFNIAFLSLQGAVGLSIFHAILANGDSLGPRGWIAAAIAAGLSSALAAAIFVGAMVLVQGRDAFAGVGQMFFMTAVTAVSNVSLALIGASLIDYDPIALVLLAVPTACLYGAYRAYTAEWAQRDRVQAMHELALEVRSIRDRSGIGPVLRLAVDHLGARTAELVLFPGSRPGGRATRFHVDAETEVVSDLLMSELDAALRLTSSLESDRVKHLADGVEPQIVGVMLGAEAPIGMLLISGRRRAASDFSDDDIAMFTTIVEQLGLTFEKDQLGQAVLDLERRGRELEHEVYHDNLTGLPNRLLLATRLEDELGRDRSPSLLYVDLDDFKDVNDQYGHAAGDQVLVEIARRFENAVGAGDCVARLGGDEFAVLLGEVSDDIEVARSLLDVASEPIATRGGLVQIHASIGVARGGCGSDASMLLHRADSAMYRAKEAGKGSLALAG